MQNGRIYGCFKKTKTNRSNRSSGSVSLLRIVLVFLKQMLRQIFGNQLGSILIQSYSLQ